MNNYTPLVISRYYKIKQPTKPTQTGINWNKYTFCILKSSEPPKNLKNSRVTYLGLVLPHETVPLREKKTGNMQSYLAGAQTKSFFSSRPALGSVQEMMSLARSFRRLSHWSSTHEGSI